MDITAKKLREYETLKDEIEMEVERVADIIKDLRYPKATNMSFESFTLYGNDDDLMIDAEYEWYACGSTDYENIQFPASYLWSSDELGKLEEHEKERRRLAAIKKKDQARERDAAAFEDRQKQYLKLKEEYESL